MNSQLGEPPQHPSVKFASIQSSPVLVSISRGERVCLFLSFAHSGVRSGVALLKRALAHQIKLYHSVRSPFDFLFFSFLQKCAHILSSGAFNY